jgi:hypothetical protein
MPFLKPWVAVLVCVWCLQWTIRGQVSHGRALWEDPARHSCQTNEGGKCLLFYRLDVGLMCTLSVSGQRYPCIKRACLLPKPRFCYNTNEFSRHRACVSPVGA